MYRRRDGGRERWAYGPKLSGPVFRGLEAWQYRGLEVRTYVRRVNARIPSNPKVFFSEAEAEAEAEAKSESDVGTSSESKLEARSRRRVSTSSSSSRVANSLPLNQQSLVARHWALGTSHYALSGKASQSEPTRTMLRLRVLTPARSPIKAQHSRLSIQYSSAHRHDPTTEAFQIRTSARSRCRPLRASPGPRRGTLTSYGVLTVTRRGRMVHGTRYTAHDTRYTIHGTRCMTSAPPAIVTASASASGGGRPSLSRARTEMDGWNGRRATVSRRVGEWTVGPSSGLIAIAMVRALTRATSTPKPKSTIQCMSV